MPTRNPRSLAVLAAALAIGVAAARAEPWIFGVDAAASSVMIHVGKAGVLGFAGHIHDVSAPALSGTVTTGPDGQEPYDVALSFDAAALRVVDKDESPGVRAEIQAVMLGPRVLDAARFPVILYKFKASPLAVPGPGPAFTLKGLDGELTLHGVSRPVGGTASCSLSASSTVLTARGTCTIRQTSFGITPVTAAGGTIRVRDEVDITFDIVARRRPAGAVLPAGLSGFAP
jgi:polyisoprenoid-binding protein YceI